MYESAEDHPYLVAAEAALRDAKRWIFVFPEYNGSFPGALKLLIDALSVRDYKTLFGNRAAALIGTASGRAGNLRGIDHLTAVLHHLGTTLMPQGMPISLIDTILENETLVDPTTEEALHLFLDRFLAYNPLAVAEEV